MGITLGILAWLLLASLASKGSAVASILIFGLWIYGIYRAFCAHWLAGVVAIFVPPITVGLTLISLFAQRDFAREIVRALSRPRR